MSSDDLVFDGVCPVCGDEFIDGFDPLEAGESYDGRICVTDKDDETGEGHMLVHLETENKEETDDR